MTLADALVARSGYALVAADKRESLEHAAEAMVLDVVNDRMSFHDLVDWFKKRIRRRQHRCG